MREGKQRGKCEPEQRMGRRRENEIVRDYRKAWANKRVNEKESEKRRLREQVNQSDGVGDSKGERRQHAWDRQGRHRK